MDDIKNRSDLIILIDAFYKKMMINPLLGPVFIDIAHIDLDHHLPILYDFWGTLLLGEQSYQRNAMEPHLKLSKLTTLTAAHFDEWMALFNATVDELFVGPKAEEAKYRAKNIAGLMQYKIKEM